MDTIQISKLGTFLIRLDITREKVFYRAVKLQDLSQGYTAKGFLTAEKQVLINSKTEKIELTEIKFENNSIVISIPTSILRENTYYHGNIYIYNDNLNYPIYNFQLNLSDFEIQKSIIYEKKVVLTDSTYELLTLNSFNS